MSVHQWLNRLPESGLVVNSGPQMAGRRPCPTKMAGGRRCTKTNMLVSRSESQTEMHRDHGAVAGLDQMSAHQCP